MVSTSRSSILTVSADPVGTAMVIDPGFLLLR